MGLTIIPKPANPANYSPSRQWNGTAYHVRLIVIHTEDGFESGTDTWFANGNSHVSAHYSLALSGETHQHVAEGDTAWHAGNWLVNLQSIGIEFEDNANPQGVERTDAQYQAGAQLIADLCQRYNIPCNRQTIIKHNEIPNATHPECPGNENVDELVRRAQSLIGGIVTAGVSTTTPGFPRDVTVTLNALRVRAEPNTTSAVITQPTPDGLLHQGQTFTAAGVVAGQDVDYGSSLHTDQWIVSSRGHYVWAGGTNYPWQAGHTGIAQEVPVRVVENPVETVESFKVEPMFDESLLPEWEETFTVDKRSVRLKNPPAYAIDMTGVYPMQEVPYSEVQVAGWFILEGRKYWKGSGETKGWYGIKDEDIQDTTDGHAISARHTYRDPLGKVIRRLPFSGSNSNNSNNG
jgi:N-acetylmuramoyl-L-alanine amidase